MSGWGPSFSPSSEEGEYSDVQEEQKNEQSHQRKISNNNNDNKNNNNNNTRDNKDSRKRQRVHSHDYSSSSSSSSSHHHHSHHHSHHSSTQPQQKQQSPQSQSYSSTYSNSGSQESNTNWRTSSSLREKELDHKIWELDQENRSLKKKLDKESQKLALALADKKALQDQLNQTPQSQSSDLEEKLKQEIQLRMDAEHLLNIRELQIEKMNREWRDEQHRILQNQEKQNMKIQQSKEIEEMKRKLELERKAHIDDTKRNEEIWKLQLAQQETQCLRQQKIIIELREKNEILEKKLDSARKPIIHTILTTENKNKARIWGEYTSFQKILVLNETNFSFTLGLTQCLRSCSQITSSTSYSNSILSTNFPQSIENIAKLNEKGIKALFEIDPKELVNHFDLSIVFDRIIFFLTNSSQNDQECKETVGRFFISSKKFLFQSGYETSKRLNGEVHLILFESQFESWRVLNIAFACGMLLKEYFKLDPDDYPGFSFDINSQDDETKTGEIRTYVFCVVKPKSNS